MTPTETIDQHIASLTDWRGGTLAAVRKAILAADPEITEDWKWMGSPVWSRSGLVVVADAHKTKVKVTFAHGAKLADSDALFNGQDNGQTRRSIDIFETDTLNAPALTRLVQAAIDYNLTHLKKNAGKAKSKEA